MEKVVYLLGAGFSAPLGLPVMSNFLIKSKDAFAADPDKYAHFQEVFKTIDGMHVCKSYFDADLWNIEEILSILEMREGLAASSVAQSFTKYIIDVIQHYTPRSQPPPVVPTGGGTWQKSIFGDGRWSHYAAFVASLFNLQVSVSWPNPGKAGTIKFTANPSPRMAYSVATLNYDSVLEDVCSFLNLHHPSDSKVQFQRDPEWSGTSDALHIPLAKLHGSVGSDEVIAPTWNKHLHPHIVSDWKMAHALIGEANHIRVLGYSLPTSDAYIKYLLKSAVVNSKNLKTIDVLCRGAAAKKNYDDFVEFNFYRFKDANLEDYVAAVHQESMDFHHYGTERVFDKIESMHERFMNSK